MSSDLNHIVNIGPNEITIAFTKIRFIIFVNSKYK